MSHTEAPGDNVDHEAHMRDVMADVRDMKAEIKALTLKLSAALKDAEKFEIALNDEISWRRSEEAKNTDLQSRLGIALSDLESQQSRIVATEDAYRDSERDRERVVNENAELRSRLSACEKERDEWKENYELAAGDHDATVLRLDAAEKALTEKRGFGDPVSFMEHHAVQSKLKAAESRLGSILGAAQLALLDGGNVNAFVTLEAIVHQCGGLVGRCGKCGDQIRPDPLTGTTCACVVERQEIKS